MKKIEHRRLSVHLRAVTLYLGDIHHLLDSIRPDSKHPVIAFEHDETIYDSLDELREHVGDILRTLEITIRLDENMLLGRISVEFKEKDIWIWADRQCELQFHRATEFLKSKRRLISAVPEGVIFAAGALLWLAIISAPAVLSRYFKLSTAGVVVVGLASVVGIWRLVTKGIPLERNLLFLQKRHQRQTFWQRHQGDIVKGLTTGIIGYLARLVQEMLTKSY